jgi:Holliday junction resolvase
MSRGPEANFWSTIRKNLPEKCFATRIENKHGGGVPDVHAIWDGIAFWAELKTVKNNKPKISPHQIAWNMAYWARGGNNFYLVKALSTKRIYLFGGDKGPELLEKGIEGVEGQSFEDLASLFAALRLCCR